MKKAGRILVPAGVIAEVISNYVSYTIRSNGKSYHPELLDWTIDIWGDLKAAFDPIVAEFYESCIEKRLQVLEGVFKNDIKERA